MKLTPDEVTLIRFLENCGGTYCGSQTDTITKDARRVSRKLQSRGILIIEDTQDGPRFTLRETVHA